MRLLLITLLSVCFSCFAATADIDAQITTLESQLSQYENQPDSQLRELYQQAIQNLQELKQKQSQARDLRQEIAIQPERLEQARQRPANTDTGLPDSEMPVDQLEQQLVKVKTRLIDQQQLREELTRTLRESDQIQQNRHRQLAESRQLLKETELNAAQMLPDSELRKAQHRVLETQQQKLQARIEVTELELLVLPGRAELAALNLKQLEQQISAYQNWINLGEQTLQLSSRQATEQTISKLESERSDSNPLLQQSVDQNNQRAQEIRALLSETEATVNARKNIEQKLQLIRQTYAAIQLQMELGVGYTGSEIRKHIQQLPNTLKSTDTEARIKQLRLSQLSLTQSMVTDSGGGLSPQQQQDLQQLHQVYNELITEQRAVQQKLINELSQLLIVQDQFNLQLTDSRALFNKHLLWLPNVEPLSTNWPAQLISGTRAFAETLPARLSGLTSQLAEKLYIPVLLILIVLPLALFTRRYLQQRLPGWSQQIGNVTHDHIGHTLRALFYAPLVTLPIPLFLYGSGQIIDAESTVFRNIFNTVTLLSWLYLTQLQWLQQPYGLLQGHFGLSEQLISEMKQRLRWLFWLNTPLIALLMLMDLSQDELTTAGPSRLILLLITMIFTLFWLSLWRVAPLLLQEQTKLRLWTNLRAWIVLLTLFNLAMMLLILWGYMLSASILIGLVFIFVCIAILAYMIYQLGRRWLLIEERKLNFARVLARRAEVVSARQEQKEEPPLKEDFVDLQTISAHSNTLLKTFTAVIFFSLLWLSLGWALPTLEVLDTITLWNTNSDQQGVIQSITLKQTVFAIVALMITLIAARNLPGILELLVLNYLPLAPGTSFAISTLLKYSLIIIGLVSFLNFLGLEWGKLQWLIAALGVGLGFGLQEIVANFVSGLIILFEKPVRIGDTVTIGGVTGTVSRIHIRATTITDWDRKEVIIPNKTFITDQLINWSLTDAVTRVVIPVGVAYGSDNDKVGRLLLQAAAENPNVLQDPEPAALLMNFGDSTLNFELRAHVSSMDNRSRTIHELHTAIDRLFRQHNIEIAFPQLDLHVRSSGPDQD